MRLRLCLAASRAFLVCGTLLWQPTNTPDKIQGEAAAMVRNSVRLEVSHDGRATFAGESKAPNRKLARGAAEALVGDSMSEAGAYNYFAKGFPAATYNYAYSGLEAIEQIIEKEIKKELKSDSGLNAEYDYEGAKDLAAMIAEAQTVKIENAKVAEQLEYPFEGEDGREGTFPECMLGLWYMDQLGLTVPTIQKEDDNYPPDEWNQNGISGRDFPEYTTAFSFYNGVCLRLGVKMRWLVGTKDPSCGVPMQFCRSEKEKEEDPCEPGSNWIASVNDDVTGNVTRQYNLTRTKWGWNRSIKEKVDALQMPGPGGKLATWLTGERYFDAFANYPVVPIVDGKKKHTKFFKYFLDEANNDIDCDYAKNNTFLQKCPQNVHEKGWSIVCCCSAPGFPGE